MKTMKWLAAVAVPLFILLLGVLVVLKLSIRHREASIRPLSVGELRRMASKFEGAEQRPVNNRHDSAPLSSGQRLNEAGDDPYPAGAAANATRQDGPTDRSCDVAAGNTASARRATGALRLAARPTPEQIAKHILPLYAVYGDDEDSARWKREFETSTTVYLGSAVWMARSDATDPWTCSIPGAIARQYLRDEDLDAAVPYLREAVRLEKADDMRTRYCATLAWFEEDPEVAAALVVQSCQGEPDGFFYPSAAQNAIELSVLTHSDALAEYVFTNYRDSWPDWLAGELWFSPETRAWLEARGAVERK